MGEVDRLCGQLEEWSAAYSTNNRDHSGMVCLALLDALLRLDADVPDKCLLRCMQGVTRAAAFVLATYGDREPVALLERVFNETPPRMRDKVWHESGELLVRWAPDRALPLLLRASRPWVVVVAVGPNGATEAYPPSVSDAQNDDWDGVIIPEGYPPLPQYRNLWVDPQSGQVRWELEYSSESIWYTIQGRGGESGRSRMDVWLRQVAGVDALTGIDSWEEVVYVDPEQFRQDARNVFRKAQSRIDAWVGRLREVGKLADGVVLVAPIVERFVWDDREIGSPPLPRIRLCDGPLGGR